jgi:hypothetical protein
MQKAVQGYKKVSKVSILVDTWVTWLLTDDNGQISVVKYHRAGKEGSLCHWSHAFS